MVVTIRGPRAFRHTEQERRSAERQPLRSVADMNNINHIIIETEQPDAAQSFYSTAFGLTNQVQAQGSDAPTTGFRGFTLSLIVSQPSTVSSFFDSAVAAGATILKPIEKSLWGVGGVIQAPDGTIWQIATSAKKDSGPATREFDKIVLLLGAEDVGASKKFYVARGLTVGKSFGSYVDFAVPTSPIGLGLYKRRALAKTVGVAEEGSGSHRMAIGGDGDAFADPDGFAWTAVRVPAYPGILSIGHERLANGGPFVVSSGQRAPNATPVVFHVAEISGEAAG
jgi:predicted enzyme related to lactoylglutathione lyase